MIFGGMNNDRISKKQDCRGDSQDRNKCVCKVHTEGSRGRYQEKPNFKRAIQAKGVIMDFIEINLNNCFSALYRIKDIKIIVPNIVSKIENRKDKESLIKSFEPYNKENSEVKSYDIHFYTGAIVTISCLDYAILKTKIKRLQGGVL